MWWEFCCWVSRKCSHWGSLEANLPAIFSCVYRPWAQVIILFFLSRQATAQYCISLDSKLGICLIFGCIWKQVGHKYSGGGWLPKESEWRNVACPYSFGNTSLDRMGKSEDKGELWQGKFRELVSDSKKILYQSVGRSHQRPGFQQLAFRKTKQKADLKRKYSIWATVSKV